MRGSIGARGVGCVCDPGKGWQTDRRRSSRAATAAGGPTVEPAAAAHEDFAV
jgi:hypothetical protein